MWLKDKMTERVHPPTGRSVLSMPADRYVL